MCATAYDYLLIKQFYLDQHGQICNILEARYKFAIYGSKIPCMGVCIMLTMTVKKYA